MEMNGQQLHRGDTERRQVVEHGVGANGRIGAPQFLRHHGVQLRDAAYVHFIDQRFVHGRARRPVVAPGERGVGHGASGANAALSRGSNDKSVVGSPSL